MSIQGAVQGIIPGAGQSFPVAGVRAKVRKFALFTSSGVWMAPLNVHQATFAGCGGGGGGSTNTNAFTWVNGGGGAAALAPSAVTVQPGGIYTITIGAGGASGTSPTAGGNTSITGPMVFIRLAGGGSGYTGSSQQTTTNGGTVPSGVSSLGLSLASGGRGSYFDAVNQFQVASGVEAAPGGASPSYRGGGGASLYAAGGDGVVTGSPAKPGYGAGSGSGTAAGGSGGDGFVYIVWEE